MRPVAAFVGAPGCRLVALVGSDDGEGRGEGRGAVGPPALRELLFFGMLYATGLNISAAFAAIFPTSVFGSGGEDLCCLLTSFFKAR